MSWTNSGYNNERDWYTARRPHAKESAYFYDEDRYTFSMTTTIKVSSQLRDRLKEQAHNAGRTLGAHLAFLADFHDRENRLAALATAVAATTEKNAASYTAETADWEAPELADASLQS